MALRKSKPEEQAEMLLRVIEKGRASARQAAVVLGVARQTVINRIEAGKMRASCFVGPRYYVSLRELIRCGLVLPYLPEYQDRIQFLLDNDPLKDEPDDDSD